MNSHIEFEKDEAYNIDGKLYSRLLMTVVRTFPLGDRDDGTVEVYDDRVVISKSRYREEETVIEFEE